MKGTLEIVARTGQFSVQCGRGEPHLMYPYVESQACVSTGMGASFLEHLRLISKKRGMSSLQTTLAIFVTARCIRKSACMLRTSVVRLEHWGVVVLSLRGRSEVADSGNF